MASEGELIKPLATSVDKFGRPSKLTVEVIAKAWEYLNNTTSIAVNAGGLLPTKERLAYHLGVSRQTIDNWKDSSPEFLDICNTMDLLQTDMLIQNGLVGRYTPAITAIMLSRHNYVKREEQDNKHEIVQPILGAAAKKSLEELDVYGDTDDPQATQTPQTD
jgi:hypothetical protein